MTRIIYLLKKLIRLILSSHDDKRMQSIDLIGTYAHRKSKDLASKKKELNVTI